MCKHHPTYQIEFVCKEEQCKMQLLCLVCDGASHKMHNKMDMNTYLPILDKEAEALKQQLQDLLWSPLK